MIFVIFLVVYLSYLKYRRFIDRITLYSSYNDIDHIVERSKDLVYSNVLTNYVAVEIFNGTRLNNDQLLKIGKEYIKSLTSLIGISIFNDLILIYGSEEALLSNWLYEFNIKVITDEISRYEKFTKQTIDSPVLGEEIRE